MTEKEQKLKELREKFENGTPVERLEVMIEAFHMGANVLPKSNMTPEEKKAYYENMPDDTVYARLN